MLGLLNFKKNKWKPISGEFVEFYDKFYLVTSTQYKGKQHFIVMECIDRDMHPKLLRITVLIPADRLVRLTIQRQKSLRLLYT